MSAVPILPTRSAAETTVVESGAITLTNGMTDAVVVAAASSGPYRAADVWFECPEDWLGTDEDVRMRIMGRVRGARVFLGEAKLSNSIKSVSSGTATGLVLFVRGVEVDGFEAEVQRASEGASSLEDARFILRAGGDAGPVGLSFGEIAGTVVTVFGGQVNTVELLRARAAYAGCTTAAVGTGTSGTKSILYVHHGSGVTDKQYDVHKVVVSYLAGAGTGYIRARVARFGAQNGTPGGSSGITSISDPEDGSTSAVVKQGANEPSSRSDVTGILVPATSSGHWEWSAGASGKALCLRRGQAEGVEVRVEVNGTVTTEMQFEVSIHWTEH